MPYTTTYRIGGRTHTLTTEYPVPGVDAAGVLPITPSQQDLYAVLIDMLDWFQQIANEHSIQWFALSGTLLGACRNRGFIPGDDDVDIGVTLREYPKLARMCADGGRYRIKPYLCGFQVMRSGGKPYPALDIFVMGEERGRLVYAGPFYKDRPLFYNARLFEKEWLPIADADSTMLCTFEHLRIPIPRNADEWLQRVYGEDCLVRCVPDTRSSWIHQLSAHLPMHQTGQAVGWIVRDVLRLDTSEDPDTHYAGLVYYLVSSPAALTSTLSYHTSKMCQVLYTFFSHRELEANRLRSAGQRLPTNR